jgi:hypothetical protein
MRTKEFDRNPELEARLKELSGILEIANQSIPQNCTDPQKPVLLVVGAPRSGTTLSLQVLAASGGFSYPTNLLARFYASPYIGALTQEILTNPKLDFRGELLNREKFEFCFSSAIGKTKGLLSPSEFWYFWRKFIPNSEIRKITADEEQLVDTKGLRSGIASIEKVHGKPFAAKGMILQYNLQLLHQIFPKVLFLFVTRNPLFNAQSLLQARLNQSGDKGIWYSAKPPGYENLLKESPENQVLGQVLMTNSEIRKSLKGIPPENWLEYDYSELCANPGGWLDLVAKKCHDLGGDLQFSGHIPKSFDSQDKWVCSDGERHRIETGYNEMRRHFE